MKFIVFISYFFPHSGGQEAYFLHLARELVQKGHAVDIVTNNTENAARSENLEGINIYRLRCLHLLGGTYPVTCKRSFKNLMQHLSKNKYDLAVTSTRFYLLSLYGLRWANKNGIRNFHVEHGTRHSVLSNPLVSLVSRLVDHTIGRYIIKNSWKVAGVCDAAKQFIKHLYQREASVLYNSVDTDYFKSVQTDLKQRLEIEESEKIVTFVGRLIQAKGVQDLIAATKGMNGCKVLIVGDGDFRERLRDMAHSNVLFLGKKRTEDLKEILSITDIFVNPSYSEGLPTCVLEAGSMGLSVIATDTGGTKEIITDGENGFLIRPRDCTSLGNKIAVLLVDKEMRETLGKKLQSTVEQTISWNKTTDTFLGCVNAN